jgi:hypothetical protein
LWSLSTLAVSDTVEISGNTAVGGGGGGGIAVQGSSFTMSGGIIGGNIAGGYGGGGVSMGNSTFTMSGGTISGNTGTYSGGGVYLTSNSNFSKTGGAVIYGYNGGDPNSNKVVDGSNAVIPDGGHAVYVNNAAKGYPRRNNTVSDNLSYTRAVNPANAALGGVWDRDP